MKTTKASKQKRAEAVAFTALFGDGTGRRIVGMLTTELGAPSDGKPVWHKSGATLPRKGTVTFKTTVQLDDGSRWSIQHRSITGHPPPLECILEAAKNSRWFSPEPRSHHTKASSSATPSWLLAILVLAISVWHRCMF